MDVAADSCAKMQRSQMQDSPMPCHTRKDSAVGETAASYGRPSSTRNEQALQDGRFTVLISSTISPFRLKIGASLF